MGVVSEPNLATVGYFPYSVQRRAKSWPHCDRNSACFAIFVSQLTLENSGSWKIRISCFAIQKKRLRPSTLRNGRLLDGAWRSTGIKQAFRSNFFTKQDIIQYLNISQGVLWMSSPILRSLWLTGNLGFDSSALNQQQSGLWRLCEFLKYPFVMLKLSDR